MKPLHELVAETVSASREIEAVRRRIALALGVFEMELGALKLGVQAGVGIHDGWILAYEERPVGWALVVRKDYKAPGILLSEAPSDIQVSAARSLPALLKMLATRTKERQELCSEALKGIQEAREALKAHEVDDGTPWWYFEQSASQGERVGPPYALVQAPTADEAVTRLNGALLDANDRRSRWSRVGKGPATFALNSPRGVADFERTGYLKIPAAGPAEAIPPKQPT